MKSADMIEKKELLLERTFKYLVGHGLENIHMRDLCKNVGAATGSIYYWFKSKEQLICNSAEYGLQRIIDRVFGEFFTNFEDIDVFFDSALSKISLFKKELRFIYQMAASPLYGDVLRNHNESFYLAYDHYTEKMAKMVGCDIEQLRPLIYIFAACVLDFVIWEDEVETKIQIDYIRERFNELINK